MCLGFVSQATSRVCVAVHEKAGQSRASGGKGCRVRTSTAGSELEKPCVAGIVKWEA